MTKSELVDIIKLLSALESFLFSTEKRIPDWLIEDTNNAMDSLKKAILEPEK